MKLTLFGVRCHLLHESNEVEQELSVVVGQVQIIAVLPEKQTRYFNSEKRRLKTNTSIKQKHSASFVLHRVTQYKKWGSTNRCVT